MIACREAESRIPLYIDNELARGEAEGLERHLAACTRCNEMFETLREVSDNIRAARPVYADSPESEARVRELIGRKRRWVAVQRWRAVAAIAAAFLVAMLLRPARADRFSEFAAGSHVRYANGAAPLDVASSEPGAVSRWLAPRLPFHFKLPDYVNEPDSTKKYSLEGARLLQYGDADVAYLAYRMNRRPISLLVASASSVRPMGGQTFRTGGIDFHFSSERGLRLITWRDRELSYALVSDLDVTGAESCVICHGTSAERKKIGTLPE
jgi:anti-sigma factor RsiW